MGLVTRVKDEVTSIVGERARRQGGMDSTRRDRATGLAEGEPRRGHVPGKRMDAGETVATPGWILLGG